MGGLIYFWRYARVTRNYPGYHFCADDAGCAHLLDRMRSRRTMRMSRPLVFDLERPTAAVLAVPNNRRFRPNYRPKLTIAIDFDRIDDLMDIRENERTIEIRFSLTKQTEFAQGVRSARSGEGDWCMSGRDSLGHDTSIWFWWHPLHSSPKMR